MTMALPLVSIVVPAYNHAAFLPLALDSLLAQDYPALEVLVLDDGSTDATPEVLERYTGRIRWERHVNMGQAATLNKGWRMARGDILGYLSADDMLDSSAVSRVAKVLVENAGTVLAYPDYRLVDARGKAIKTVRAPDFDYRSVLATWDCPPGPGALFRRDAAEAVGFWDTELRLTPDYAFWLRLATEGACRRVPETLAGFRVHEGSQTFGAVSPHCSDEYVRVSTQYYAQLLLPPQALGLRAEATASAYLMSARSHLRSARYLTGLRRLITAVRIDPQSVRPRTAKLLAHGLLAHHREARRLRRVSSADEA